MLTRDSILVLSVFLASIVEGVEALTIVLAVGMTRGWRSTVYGIGAALLTLGVFVAVLGPALTAIPLNTLRIAIGGLLLIFGLQWLRKAILRAGGKLRTRDEAAIYVKATTVARATNASDRKSFIDDWYSFTVSFKGVLLEGLEVAFIVVTFGVAQGSLPLAVVGAMAAILIVVGAGFIVHKPLAKVPENTLKFGVGVMLTSFGMFWGGEGIGVHWPGSDAALLVVILFTATCAVVLTTLLRDHSTPIRRAT